MEAKTPEDRALWASAVQDVQRLPPRTRHRRAPARIHGAAQHARDEAAVMPDALSEPILPDDFASGDETEFRHEGVSRAQIRKLRRGVYAVQATLDLHGHTRVEASERVRHFLAEAERRGWRAVKIIPGKGLRSPGGLPVLKSRVEISLQRSASVLAYASAPPWAGGHGALLVLLRSR